MYDPIIANLHRCIDGKRGKELLAAQQRARLAARGHETVAQPIHPVTDEPPTPTEPVARTRQRLGMPK
jgi:type IV secretion system protein VirD4